MALNQGVIFTESGTFTVPAGVTSVDVELWGGGGSGGVAVGTAGRATGGGAGAYSKKENIAVTPLAELTVTVGTGGTSVSMNSPAGSGNSTQGNAGNDSWFIDTSTILAKGGGAGQAGTDAVAPQANGGAAASGVGDTKFSGGNGASSSNVGSTGGGGGAGDGADGGSSSSNGSNATTGGGSGGAVGGGNGGTGAFASGTGSVATAAAGNVRGGAGGGATALGANSTANSGAGFRGEVRISYQIPIGVLTATATVKEPTITTGANAQPGVLTATATLKEPTVNSAVAEVATLKPYILSDTSVKARGKITFQYENATKRGFVYGTTTQNPGNVAPGSSGYDSFVEESGSFGAVVFELDITSLDNDTDYFIRAFAENTEGFAYGNEIKFKIGDWIPRSKGDDVTWTPIAK